MRKIFLLLAMVSTAAFTGCTINDDQPDVIENNNYFEAEAIEITNVNFTPGNEFTILHVFQNDLLYSDVVLVYRLSELSTNTDIWELIPRTITLEGGNQLSYDFNFTRQDVEIYMNGNFDLTLAPAFTIDQVFRIVKIPAFNPDLDRLDLSDYNAVAQRYNITEATINKVVK